ncbi:hypothetical protein ABZ372_29195, partial [Streptomyces sp. NPDC005921]
GANWTALDGTVNGAAIPRDGSDKRALTGSVDVQIRVPENVSLRGTGGGVLGNFEADTLDSVDPDAPVVYIDGWAVLGNVEARPKRGKLIEDILERVHDKVDRKLRKHLDR